ncbi:hypothetical protein Cgig2_018561 [Carnegiea gigantea]|uniref:Uncharacterized protein n=1 Tax=Carnegiea gigantea TaxID=171969 RepID=A0A9Q1QMK7_9CARY|nr:hypothetical protein Cgig2_018561 [Carnegiea gigantea]
MPSIPKSLCCVVLTTSLYILLEAQVLTISLYDRTLLCIGDGNEIVSYTQAERQNTDHQSTQYGEDTIFDISKRLAKWLLEKYDLRGTSLNPPKGKVLIYEEDVHATLGLRIGLLEISEDKSSKTDIEFLEQWRKRWNIERCGPSIGSIDDVILEGVGHGPKFTIDFIMYAISTCIVANAGGTCHFCALKYLQNANEIHNYYWCAYVIKCLNDAVIECKGDKSKFFQGPLLFLMISGLSAFYHPISLMFTQLLYLVFLMKITNFNIYNVLLCKLVYLDRVEFRADKVERWFPIAINWQTEKLKKKDRDEQLPREYERGRIIGRIVYQNYTSKNWKRNSTDKEYLLKSNDVHIVHIATDNFKTLYLSIMTQCSINYTYQFESIRDNDTTLKNNKNSKKRMDFTPPSFSLRISSEKGRCASRSLDIAPTMLKFGFSLKGAINASIAEENHMEAPNTYTRKTKKNQSLGTQKEYMA